MTPLPTQMCEGEISLVLHTGPFILYGYAVNMGAGVSCTEATVLTAAAPVRPLVAICCMSSPLLLSPLPASLQHFLSVVTLKTPKKKY